MANNQIITTGLDFDSIKENIKAYFRGQNQFSDYDFEGSALSFLIDVLSYNTHYNALYTNLALNESFLDSASKRSSVVSKAKELGYVPKSARSSTAIVDIVFQIPNSPESSLILPFNTPILTTIDGVTYTFNTTQSSLAYNNNGIFAFTDVVIKEGVFINNTYVYSEALPLKLQNPFIDTSTLTVQVFETPQSTTFETFVLADRIVNLNSTSPIYFLKEIEQGYYQIEFGDGILGKSVVPGNMIVLTYLTCQGSAANRAKVFTYGGPTFNSPSVPLVLTRSESVNGSDPEDVENIRWNAPRFYSTQDRCITIEDYKSVIYANFPSAQAINVWGGEDNIPPSYSDVFISIKPSTGEVLTQSEKDYILNEIIKPRKSLTIHPKFVDPDFLFVDISVSYYYIPTNTILTSGDINQLIFNTITQYSDDNLNKFQGILRHSNLVSLIDKVDKSITSNITTIRLEKEVRPSFNQSAQYTIDIGNPIYNSGVPEESVTSTGFYIINYPQMVFIRDIPTEGSRVGELELYYFLRGNKTRLRTIGIIDYQEGVITTDPLTITQVDGDSLRVFIKPESNDVVAARNQIVTILPEMIKITANRDISVEGFDRYQFTSSRR